MAEGDNKIILNDSNTCRDVIQNIIQNYSGPLVVNETVVDTVSYLIAVLVLFFIVALCWLSKQVAVQDCENDYCSNHTIDDLKEILKKTYRDLKLPTKPWLEEGEKLFIKDYFVQLELKDTKEIIPLDQVFIEKEKMEEIKEICIEAPPGFGKTTLTYKFMTDWVTNEKYVEKFNLAFLVVLKYLPGKSVTTMLSEIVKHRYRNNLWELINKEDTIIIFDGLDEIGEEDKCKVINFTVQFRGTIIITGRTGSFELDSHYTEKTFYGVDKDEFTGRYITISGINKKDRVDFLSKYFNNSQNWEKIKNKIGRLTVSLDEMFISPLMLILLAYVLNKKPELNIEDESVTLYKTNLYKHLINILIIRCRRKTNKNIESDFDLFSDEKARSDDMVEIFDKFGSMALKNLENDNLQFEPNGIVEKTYQLGFLLKHENKSKFNTQVHFEGLHLSIIEFAAAISLWFYRKKNTKFADDQLIHIRNLIVNKGEKSLVVSFLCGLMGKNVKELFIELQPHYGFFIQKDISFLLRECEMDDLLGEAISPLISNYLHFNKKSSIDILHLMKYGIDFQKLKFICTDFELLKYLPTNLDGLILSVKLINYNCKSMKIINNLKCKKIIFSFVHGFEESDSLYRIIFKTFNNIDSETKKLEIDFDPKMLLNLLQRKVTKIARIDELRFTLNSKRDELSFFEQIFSFFIEHCQVESFECLNFHYKPLSNIIKLMSKPSFLKSVHIYGIGNNEEYKLIEELCQNISFDRFSIKSWPFEDNLYPFSNIYRKFYPSTKQSILGKENNEINENFFHNNEVWGNECKLKFNPKKLTEISLLKTDILKSTTGLDKVIELKLYYDRDIFWKNVKSCKHVRTITLLFYTTENLDDFLKELENVEKITFSKLNLIIETSLEFFKNSLWANKFLSEMLKISLVKTLVLNRGPDQFQLGDKNEIDMVSTLNYHWLFPYLHKLINLGAVDTVLIYVYKYLRYLPLDVNCMFSNFDTSKLQCEREYISDDKMSFKISLK